MMMNGVHNFCFWFLLLCTSLRSLVDAQMAGDEIPFKTIFQGAYSSINTELKTVYRNNDEYIKFFMRHCSDCSAYSTPMPPPINFADNNSIVAALYLGNKNSGGYSVKITNVYLEEELDGDALYHHLVIEYVTKEPGPNDIVPQVLTQPHHVVEIGPIPGIDQQSIDYVFEKKMENESSLPGGEEDYLRFLITFEETSDPNVVLQKIQDNFSAFVTNVQLLGAVKVGIVDFDASNEAMSAPTAQELLTKIDGVNTVELDSIVVDFDSTVNDETTIEALPTEQKAVLATNTVTTEQDDNEKGGAGALTPLRFILIIDEKVEISTIEETILSLKFFTDILHDIQLLSGVGIMFVDFDETKMSNNEKTKLEVQEHLQNIKGVATVEEDGIVSEVDNNNDEKEEEIGVSDNIDTTPGDDNDKESEGESSSFLSLIAGIFWH